MPQLRLENVVRFPAFKHPFIVDIGELYRKYGWVHDYAVKYAVKRMDIGIKTNNRTRLIYSEHKAKQQEAGRDWVINFESELEEGEYNPFRYRHTLFKSFVFLSKSVNRDSCNPNPGEIYDAMFEYMSRLDARVNSEDIKLVVLDFDNFYTLEGSYNRHFLMLAHTYIKEDWKPSYVEPDAPFIIKK